MILSGDPLDNKYVALKQSETYPEAGEGSFAKVDIPAHTIYVLYSAFRLTKDEFDQFQKEQKEKFEKEKFTEQQIYDSWKYR